MNARTHPSQAVGTRLKSGLVFLSLSVTSTQVCPQPSARWPLPLLSAGLSSPRCLSPSGWRQTPLGPWTPPIPFPSRSSITVSTCPVEGTKVSLGSRVYATTLPGHRDFPGLREAISGPSGADSAWSLRESSLEKGGGNQPQRKRKNSAVTKS